jgi:hypothetical protein
MNKLLLLSGFFLFSYHTVIAQQLNRKDKKLEKQIIKDINYLASDALEGRLTGSPGEKLSAEYIAAAYKKAGLKPLGVAGSYFQTFEIVTLRMATDSGILEIAGQRMKQFLDFYPLSLSSNRAELQSIAVNVGFGIQSKSPVRNDYEGKDAKGKVVIIDMGSPDGIHPHSEYLAWHGLESRVKEAIKQGAAGVVFYRNSDQVEKPDGNLSLKTIPTSIPVVYCNRELANLPLGTPINLKVVIKSISEIGHNVIGFKDNKAKHTVVIGAHHDHLGRGQMGNSLSVENGLIHNGADDNASGISALLAISKDLRKAKKWNKNNNYLFIAFSGEELGLLGSKYFTENPTIALENINYMLNMDMVGKLDSFKRVLVVNGVGTSPFWSKTIGSIALDTTKLKEIKTTDGGIGASDHTSFYLKNIPAVHFFTGQHFHYHKPSDDVEIIHSKGEVYVIRYIENIIERLNNEGKLTFTPTKSSDSTGRMKFAVTLGIMPDYIYSGEGVKVDGAKENMPGSKAGIQKGDVIINMNGVFIKDISTYMKILGGLKSGMTVPLTVKRGEEIVNLTVQF